MDKLAAELELAREELQPDWSADRSARLYQGARVFGVRRTQQRLSRAALAAVALSFVVVVGVKLRSVEPLRFERAGAGSRSEHSLRLADGSRAELVGEHSEVEIIDDTKARVGVRVLAGRAHFEVVPNTLRSFVVEARPYRVEVIGTIFDVERSANEVGVSVQRGKVRVYGPRGAEDLVAGQIKRFALGAGMAAATPDAPAAVEAATSDEDAREEQSVNDERANRHGDRSHARGAKHSAASAGWRSLSQSGQYDAAFEWLRRGSAVEDEPSALMDAADAARLSGHAADAVQYLQDVVSRHRKSPVAPLAAFTLGRVYLDQLGQPGGAAEAFELARTLAPNGSLAQDALAREVEALSKGGNAHLAYVRAQEYRQRYPNGRRLRAVQLYGGLE